MKRMSAMVLSTICIMNALASPVATAFADTNGYEVVDLSVNSDKLMGAGLAEEETASPSTMSEEASDSGEISEEMLGDLEQYRNKPGHHGEGSFTDGLGRYVKPSSTVASGYVYSTYWEDTPSIEYTHEMEVEAARAVFKKRRDAERAERKKRADLVKRVGDVEKYRTYTNEDKTVFTDVAGREVYKTDRNESGWAFASGDSEREYTQDVELQTIGEYLDKKEADEKKAQELKALEAQWSTVKKKYAYLDKDYASSSKQSDVKLYVLPDAVTLDMLDFRNYTVFKYESGEFKDLEPHYSEILDFIKRTYPDLGEVSIQRAGIANDKYGIVFTATVGDSEENPLYVGKDKLDNGYTWINDDMRKTWTFLLPVNTVNKDLIFVDAGSDRLDIKPNQEISDDALAVVKKYLIENRKLSSIDVTDKMVKYDTAGKYHYLDVKYVPLGSEEPVDAKIRFLKVEGIKHDDDNFYIDFSEGKTKLSEADIERLNESLGVMKNNVFYDFNVGALNLSTDTRDPRLQGGAVLVDFGHDADLPTYKIGSCYDGVGNFRDSDSLVYKHKIAADVPYGHNDFLLTSLKYNDIMDTDLYVYNSVLFKEQVPGSVSLNDYVKSKNGGHNIVKLIRFEQGKYYLSEGTTRLIGLSYVDDEGQTKYYMIKLKPEMTTLWFKEGGSRELTNVDERLKTKIKDVLLEKYGSIIKDVWVSDTFRYDTVNFAFSYMNGKRVAGQVKLVPDMSRRFPPMMCRPYTKTDVMIDVYMNDRNTGSVSAGYIEYDDKNYVVKVSEKVEEPKTNEAEHEALKESSSELPKDVLTPSEIVKEDKPIKSTPSELPKENVSPTGDVGVPQEKDLKDSASNSIGSIGNSHGYVRQSEASNSEKSFEGKKDTDVRIVENPSGEVAGVDRQADVTVGDSSVRENLGLVNPSNNTGVSRNVKTSDSSILLVYAGLFMTSMLGFLVSLFKKCKENE